MKFLALKAALERAENEKKHNTPRPHPPEPPRPPPAAYPRELRSLGPLGQVVGGGILRQPIDKTAALVISKPAWWAYPPPEPPKPVSPPKPKPKGKKKVKNITIGDPTLKSTPGVKQDEYISQAGLRVTTINGEPMIHIDDVHRMICDEVAKLPKETRPVVLAAQDARRVIDELLDGLGGELEKFRHDSKTYLEDIRQTRFAVVGETSAMMVPLKDVRQFFIGPDYKDQIARLREFVDLCERLQKLKDSGFLDRVTDTMLRLDQ